MSALLDFSTSQYLNNPLMPLLPGSKQTPVNLAPNTYFARGRILGQFSAAATDVQTIAFTGVPTGGYARIRAYHPFSMASGTFDLQYNTNATTAQGLIRALLGTNSVTVTGGPLPGALTFTFSGFPEMPVALMVLEANALTGGTNPSATITHATIGRSIGTYGPYASGNADGTQVAKVINMYECSTDSGGNVTFGPQSMEGNNYRPWPEGIAHYEGVFATEELVGLDATAVGQLGRLIKGTIAAGQLKLT